MLEIDRPSCSHNYVRIVEKSVDIIEKTVEDNIHVDVLRSFNYNPNIPADILNRILKAYAIVNPDLDYC